MSQQGVQKLKLLYIARFLYKYTNEKTCLSTSKIIDMLSAHDITAERKSIYSDIETLKDFGVDIENIRSKTGGFRLKSRTFQLAELKLLVDAVQSSRFITERKSYSLIKKLSTLASDEDAKELNRNVYLTNRVKNKNESIYYSTDTIFESINKKLQIKFKYFSYGANKSHNYHSNGQFIYVSPIALHFDNEKYYLIAYESKTKLIKHYRVDRMEHVSITKLPRDTAINYEKFDVAEHANKTVKMFSGEFSKVTLKCPDELAGAIMDKFGMELKFFPCEDGEYTVMVEAALSPTFYSWVFTFAGQVKITAPQIAVEEYKAQLLAALG